MTTKEQDENKHYRSGILKWDGVRGETWRVASRDIKAYFRGRFAKDDRYSFHKIIHGLDAGGADAQAPALPGGEAAATKQDIRRGSCYTELFEHVSCENVKRLLQALADGPEPAVGIGKAAWDLLVREGGEDENDLELGEHDTVWEMLSIMNTIGICLSSPNDFRRMIDITDAKRPTAHRKTEDEKARKFLSAMMKEGPPSLVAMAAKELRAEGADREFKHANNDRDLDKMVRAFDIAYLHQSKSRGLKYGGVHRPYISSEVHDSTLCGHADSSWGTNPYPHCGGFVELNGAAIDWFSRVHKFVPQSTWEAELGGINMLLKILRFATYLYVDMTGVELPTPWVLTDSKSAYDTIKNPGATKRSNHLERWLHFARELYLRAAMRYGLVPTNLMMADNLTKPVDREKFFTCIEYQMGM